jgi:hypothetical protein
MNFFLGLFSATFGQFGQYPAANFYRQKYFVEPFFRYLAENSVNIRPLIFTGKNIL